jgi:hypothetical protein
VFVAEYRKQCTAEWISMLQKFNITATKDLNVIDVLG